MNHRVGRLMFGFGVGFLVAFGAFKWISDPAPRAERQLEESVVELAREHLENKLLLDEIEIVDPLAPNRKIGKSYVFRSDGGWQVSGYYRRGAGDRWHPFLMSLDDTSKLVSLKIADGGLAERALTDPQLEVAP